MDAPVGNLRRPSWNSRRTKKLMRGFFSGAAAGSARMWSVHPFCFLVGRLLAPQWKKTWAVWMVSGPAIWWRPHPVLFWIISSRIRRDTGTRTPMVPWSWRARGSRTDAASPANLMPSLPVGRRVRLCLEGQAQRDLLGAVLGRTKLAPHRQVVYEGQQGEIAVVADDRAEGLADEGPLGAGPATLLLAIFVWGLSIFCVLLCEGPLPLLDGAQERRVVVLQSLQPAAVCQAHRCLRHLCCSVEVWGDSIPSPRTRWRGSRLSCRCSPGYPWTTSSGPSRSSCRTSSCPPWDACRLPALADVVFLGSSAILSMTLFLLHEKRHMLVCTR